MNPLIRKLTKKLEGWPDRVLTVALLLVALVLILVALRGSTGEKAIALAWAVLP